MTNSKFYRVLSLVLAFVMMVSLFSNWTMPVFAETSIKTEPIEPVITTAFKDDEVELYASVEDEALSTEVTGVAGKAIQLYNKVTDESTGEVFYQFRLAGLSTSNLGSVVDEYSFVAADEVVYQEVNSIIEDPSELMDREMTDTYTGVQVNATVPIGATLEVSKYTVPQAGVENGLIWSKTDSVFFDVKIMYDGQEYQPENGAVVVLPATAIPFAEGKTYTTYYYDNNDVLNSLNIQEPYDIQEGISVAVDYVGVVGVAVDFTEKNGNETYELLEETLTAKFANSTVKLYADNTLLEYKEFAVAENDIVSISAKSTIVYDNDNTVELYLIDAYGYSGDNAEMEEAITPSGDGLPYFYVLCSDVEEYIEPTPDVPTVDQTLTDPETGIVVSGNLPVGTTVEIKESSLAESGLDTTVYPTGENTMVFDVSFTYNDKEYQPEHVYIEIPEEKVAFDFASGYMVYNVNGEIVDVIGPVTYTGGLIRFSYNNPSKLVYTDVFTSASNVEFKSGFMSNFITFYEAPFNNATTYEIDNALDHVIYVEFSYLDATGESWHKFYNEFVECDREYLYVKGSDLKKIFQDAKYGISIFGDLPAELSVSATKVDDASQVIDTSVYALGSDTVGYDIKLSLNGQEYQPQSSVDVVFPANFFRSKAGEKYTDYHIHDGQVDVLGSYEFTGEDVVVTVDNFSYVILTSDNVYPHFVPISNPFKVSFLTDEVTLYRDTALEYAKRFLTYPLDYVTVSMEVYTKIDEEIVEMYAIDMSGYSVTDEDLKNAIITFNPDDAYVYVLKSDVREYIPLTEGVEVEDKENSTGITVTGTLPADIALSVKDGTIPEGWDTSRYPLGKHTKVLDISLMHNGVKYQPNGIVYVELPESQVPFDFASGYNFYHLHDDGTIDVVGPVAYTGGSIRFPVTSFSQFIYTDVFTTASNEEFKAGFNSNFITFYTSPFAGAEEYSIENALDHFAYVEFSYTAEDGTVWHKFYNDFVDDCDSEYLYVKGTDVRKLLSTYTGGNLSKTEAAPALYDLRTVAEYTATSRLLSTRATGSDSGLHMNKVVSAPDENGVYTITLDAYVTGEVKVTRKSMPTDIILVLDQSGSMDDDMGGQAYRDYTGNASTAYNNYRNNLYTKNGGEYVQVTVTPQGTTTDTYTVHDRNNRTENNGWYNNSDRVNNLYHKIDNNYYKVTLSTSNNSNNRNTVYTYTYVDNNGRTVELKRSTGNETNPGLTLYGKSTQTNYTAYTFTPEGGTGVTYATNESLNGKGYYYLGNENRSRLEVLKVVVEDFADAVEADANGDDGIQGTEDDVDHHLAIVGFGSGNLSSGTDYENSELFVGGNQYQYNGNNISSQYINALQDMNTQTGINNIAASIGDLDASGGTYVDLGVTMANNILAAETTADQYRYVNQKGEVIRNKVVIVFTDGAPGYNGTWSTGNYGNSGDAYKVATEALKNAKTTKNTYGATVYTIGIFSGANADITVNNNSVTLGSSANADRFMHYLSSNYTPASNVTPSMASSGNTPGTQTFPKDGSDNFNGDSFYLAASDSAALSDIFNKISTTISGTSNSELTQETVVKDIISPAFKLPASASLSSIKIKSQEAVFNANGEITSWNNDVTIPSTAENVQIVDGDTINVTGFNFKENYVASTARTITGDSEFYGRRLVIEIPIVVREDFLGGNQVPTNGEGSGIYENDITTTPVREFVSPKVNVPLKTLYPVLVDQHIYLTNPANVDKMISDYTDGNENYKYEFKLGDTIYKFDGDNNGYVNVTYNVYDSNADDATPIKSLTILAGQNTGSWTDLEPLISGLTEDKTYYIECVVTPTTAGEYDAKTSPKDAGTVYVYKPTMTVKDSTGWLGDNIPTLSDTENYLSAETVWKHGDTFSTQVTMSGEKPRITNTYTPGTGVENGIIVTTNDIPVNVKSIANGTDITEYTTYEHQNCSGKTCTPTGDAELLIHVNTVSLNVSKIVDGSDTSGNFTVTVAFKDAFEDKNFTKNLAVKVDGKEAILSVENGIGTLKNTEGEAFTLTLAHDQTVTLTNLPVGTYTATATVDDNRYDTTVNGNTGISDSVTLSSSKTSDKIAFVNKLKAGHLTIYKTVDMPEGVAINEGEEFKFTVTGTDYSETVTITVGKDGKGSVTINNLVQGNYTVTENLTVVQERLYTPDNVTQTVTVSAGSTTNAYVKNVAKTGILKVTKTVVDKAENIKPADKYTMKIELKGNIVVKELIGTIAGTETKVPVTDGIATIELANGKIAQFTNIPVGVTYKVTETGVDTSYYTVSYNNEEGTITADATSHAKVTNTRKYGKLTITKLIKDKDGNAVFANVGETFLFTISNVDKGIDMEVVIAPEKDNVNSYSVTLTNLPLGTYTVTEDTSWSYKYNTAQPEVTGEVTTTADGEATIVNVLPKTDKWLKADAYAENTFFAYTATIN